MSIADRVSEIRARMASAAERAGRNPADVHLVAVTKTHPSAAVAEVLSAGVLDVGENKVQEALSKQEELAGRGIPGAGFGRPAGEPPPEGLRWHLIGHLQTNKAKHAVRHFDLIHSVDSLRLAEELDTQCGKIQRPECRILLQVNVSGEETKGGFEPEQVAQALESILERCSRIHVAGFMTMAPFELAAEATRPHFRRLHDLADDLRPRFTGTPRFSGTELSMGMTNDFEVAIEEGATLVRIGSALFGTRG